MDEAAQGSRNKTSVLAAIDLVPSMLALADAKRPEGPPYDGENVLGTLLGESDDSRKAPLFLPARQIAKRFTTSRICPTWP